MSAPKHEMILKEIYEWFKKNTQKTGKDGPKGWEKGVPHNLSMNKVGVFDTCSYLI